MSIDSKVSRWFLLIGSVVIVAAVMPMSANAAQLQCGDEIQSNTKLFRNLTGCTGSALIVGAPNITINLNGFTIGGNGVPNALVDAGIDNSAGHAGVIVKGSPDRGGLIRGFVQGVYVEGGTTQNTIRRLTVKRNSIGVELASSGNTVSRVKALRNEDGIRVVAGGDSNVIQGSRSAANTDDGIELLGDVVSAAEQNQLLSNVVVGNSDEGIQLDDADNSTLRGNNASGNGIPNEEDGIDLDSSDGNTIESNIANSNGEDGLDLNDSHNNTYRFNKANRNPEDGVDLGNSNGNTFTDNTFNSNREDGVEQDGAEGTTYEDNTANENGDDGLDLQSNDLGGSDVPNSVVTNTVKRNGRRIEDDFGLGINANADPTVTGAGNIAVANDDPDQCEPTSASLC